LAISSSLPFSREFLFRRVVLLPFSFFEGKGLAASDASFVFSFFPSRGEIPEILFSLMRVLVPRLISADSFFPFSFYRGR